MEAAHPDCLFFQKVCVTPYYLSYKTKMFYGNLNIKKLCQVPNQRVQLFHRMSKRILIRWRNLPTAVGATVSTETVYLIR